MKQIIKTAFICGLSVSSNAFSIDPVQGLYFSPALAISVPVSSPAINFTDINGVNYAPKVTLNPVGAGFNMALGTRLNQVRLEGEFLFNYVGYNQATIGSCTLISPKVEGPKGSCPAYFSNNYIGFSGNTTSGYAFFNAFYDFLSSESTFFPYIGAGLGGAYVRNTANFRTNDPDSTTDTNNLVNRNVTTSKTGFAAQGIIGFGYFLDDFATLGLDLRYTSAFSTGNNNNTNSVAANNATSNSQHGLITINIIATFALEKTK